MTQYEVFKNLHQPGNPLLIGNAWDVTSARLLEKNGFRAIATSSLAVAHSLGYEDGEDISFDELFFVVKRIKASIHLPLSVDMEKGLGKELPAILSNMEKLASIGVAGVNIEDSGGPGEEKTLDPIATLVEKIKAIKEHLRNKDQQLFINARTDAFLLNVGQPQEKSLERINAYTTAGADGIFVPFIKNKEDIQKITSSTTLPVNVLATPGLPAFEELAACRVGRISLGSGLFRATFRKCEQLIRQVIEEKSTQSLF